MNSRRDTVNECSASLRSESGLNHSPLSKNRSKSTGHKTGELESLENSSNLLTSLQSQTKTRNCVTCGKPFRPKNRIQTHCEEHIINNKRKFLNCLWCGKPLLHGQVKWCCEDCFMFYKILGKSKAELEKEKKLK